jgi:HK97 family phage major capsid protein
VRLADVPELRPKQQPEISLERWLAATVAGDSCGDKEAVEFCQERKQMVTTSTGVLIPAEYQGQWIDMLRARSVLSAAGLRVVTMVAKTQTHSAVTGDPAVGWHTEAASISAANPTFAARTLTAQTVVCRCQASVELAQDSPDFGSQLANVMTGAIASEIDRVGLEGTGTPPEPAGILNTSGRSSQTGTSTLTDYEEIVSGIGALLAANCDLEQVSRFAIMSPGSWAAYENLATGISGDKSQLPRPRSIQDMRFLVTSNVAGSQVSSPIQLSTIYLGDFRDLLLGVRLESSIEALKLTTFASNLLLEFVGYARLDFLVTRPASFHTIEGVAA